MTQTPRRRSDDALPTPGIVGLMARKITVGWALLVCAVIFISLGLIAYSVIRNFNADNARTAESVYIACVTGNDRRADAKIVALADVDSDRDIWLAIDDLFPEGIPEPARSTIFAGLDEREDRIEKTYKQVPCARPPSLDAESAT